MRRRLVILNTILFLALAGACSRAAEPASPPRGQVLKVLLLFMDTNGLVAPSPSLFDRDAYQFFLQEHTNDISGVRFDVQWKASHAKGLNLKLRVEVHGIGEHGLPTEAVLEQVVTPKLFHHWAELPLRGPDYKSIGTVAAWRATLWNDGELLGQQQSFLWQAP